MPTVTEQLLSRTIYATDGTTTNWDFSFSGGYLLKAHVKAYTEAPSGARTEIIVTDGMFTGPYQLNISPALATGLLLGIYRDTPKDLPLVDFTDESGFSEISLDTNAKQAVFIAAEAIDIINTSSSYDAAQAAEAAASAQEAAEAALAAATVQASAAAASAVAAATSPVAAPTLAAASKTTPVDADLLPLVDSVGSTLKKLSWANLKAGITELPALSSINGGQLGGLRNRIINGDMRVAQRGSTGTVANTYGPDRWIVGFGGVAPTWNTFASGAVIGSNQSSAYMTVAGIAGNTGVNLLQRIEASNCADMAGQTVAYTYWAYQSTGVTMNVTTSAAYAPARDNWGGQTAIGTSAATPVPTATWTKITTLWAIPSAATTGLTFTCFANAPAIVAAQILGVSQVQLELGSVATTFEQRPYGMELALCQRYCQSWAATTIDWIGNNPVAGQNNTFSVAMPATMRVAPTWSNPGFTMTNGNITTWLLSTTTLIFNVVNVTGGQWRAIMNTPGILTAEL